MSLTERKRADLVVQRASIEAELMRWRERSRARKSEEEAPRPFEKHNSQILGITRQLDGLLERWGERLAAERFTLDQAPTLQSQLLDIHRLWEFFRAKLVQRVVEVQKDELACADELAWECYAPARARAIAVGFV